MNNPLENRSRRNFLKTGAGLAFTIPLATKLGSPEALAADENGEDIILENAWVVLRPDNRVTIYNHASEMGQGSYTGVPRVVAEELDADWELVDIEFSPLSDEIYGNPRYYGYMLTVGSDAISSFYDKMRNSGAQIRKTLMVMAADHWGVPLTEVSTEPSLVVHQGSGRSMTYGEVSQLGNVPDPLPEVGEDDFKDMSEYRIVGNDDLQRRDTPGKVIGGVMNGEKMFAIDVKLPNMLYATAVRTSLGYRKPIRVLNEDEVMALPDVVGVDFVDEAVTITAKTYEAARKGEKLVRAEWERAEEDAKYDTDAELERLTGLAWDNDKPGTDVMKHWRARARGNPEASDGIDEIIATADNVQQRVYTTGLMHHATMETLNAVVDVTDDGQKAEIWVGTQGPTQTVLTVAEQLDIPAENITLHRNFMGGGFGRKGARKHENVVEAAILSRKYGAPVKMIWSRETDMKSGYYRPHGAHSVRAAINDDGKITAYLHKTVSDEPLRHEDPERFERGGKLPYLAASFWGGATYDSVEKFRGEVLMDFTDLRISAMRGIGGVATAWARENFIDEMAYETGQNDPLAYRRKLFDGNDRAQLIIDTLKERCDWDSSDDLGCAMGNAGYAMAVDIDLDETTGVIKPVKVWIVTSFQVLVEPNNAQNAQIGAMIYQLGAATIEELTIKNGQHQQTNFHQFHFARQEDIPELDFHFLPVEGGRSLGAADGPGFALGPAMAGAFYRKTGKRVRHLPMSPPQVLKVLNA